MRSVSDTHLIYAEHFSKILMLESSYFYQILSGFKLEKYHELIDSFIYKTNSKLITFKKI